MTAAPAAHPVLTAAVITCSDSAACGAAGDASGPLALQLLGELGHRPLGQVMVVPDDVDRIQAAVRHAIAAGARIVVTTGGTGVGPRDVTPEALRALELRELPGLGEAMRAAARDRVPAADLSRSLGGVLDGAVVLALPGSPGGVRDGLDAVGRLLAHAVGMAAGGGHPYRATRAQSSGLVCDAPFTELELAAEVAAREAGAVVSFAGVVRDHDHGRGVVALHYEAHPDASRVLAEVVAQACTRQGVVAAAARHRVGDLLVGDLAFACAVSAAHRGSAFAACAWLVDEVKAKLPVWKLQQFTDGTDEWVNCA